jgi:serine/threonine protein kinase
MINSAEIPDNLSPELQDLLKRLLEKSPEKRIAMDELRVR